MHHRLGWLTLTAAALLAAAAAAGQTVRLASARLYTLNGTVADVEGHAVDDAEVQLLDGAAVTRRVRSDTLGKFIIADIPSARPTIRVRRVGYQPRTLDVHINEADGHSSVVITLEDMVAELQVVRITDYIEDPDARLRDYMQRKLTNNFGHYIDGETIEDRRPTYLSEMLRSIPGVTLRPSRRYGNLVKVRGCSPLVWIDGVRMPGAELDEVANPGDIAAMEIYNSFAGIPSQFFDRTATCGTIVLWTRSR